jgi:hypothetical protein
MLSSRDVDRMLSSFDEQNGRGCGVGRDTLVLTAHHNGSEVFYICWVPVVFLFN